MLTSFLLATWRIMADSAPALLFGLALAGAVHLLFPLDAVRRHLREKGLRSVLKAAAIGIPLPLCSCSVIPVGTALRRNGASSGATASFLISTPEIGADSFVLSYTLLGPALTAARLISAFVTSIAVGTAIDRFAHTPAEALAGNGGCAGNGCGCHENGNGALDPAARSVAGFLRFSFVELLDDLALPLTAGFIAAGAIEAWVPISLVSSFVSSPALSMGVMLLLSMPLYVCATASTPLAAAFLAKGIPAGAVIVFLLAGPASNVATILAVRRSLGNRALAIYFSGIAVLTLATGACVQFLFAMTDGATPNTAAAVELAETPGGLSFAGAVVILLLLAASFLRRFKQRHRGCA